MAEINDKGTIRAACPGCGGALANYEWREPSRQLGAITTSGKHSHWGEATVDFRLFKCSGCGRGALGVIAYKNGEYPGAVRELYDFYRESSDQAKLPRGVPAGIATEFREAETCLSVNAVRAAAGMFRSVLDKTLRASGYKVKPGTTLEQQIDMAADDGVITQARKKRAHDEIRVLGNDVLHDEWQPIKADDVRAARHYAQRILEDLYDDRQSVLALLRAAGRTPEEDRVEAPPADDAAGTTVAPQARPLRS